MTLALGRLQLLLTCSIKKVRNRRRLVSSRFDDIANISGLCTVGAATVCAAHATTATRHQQQQQQEQQTTTKPALSSCSVRAQSAQAADPSLLCTTCMCVCVCVTSVLLLLFINSPKTNTKLLQAKINLVHITIEPLEASPSPSPPPPPLPQSAPPLLLLAREESVREGTITIESVLIETVDEVYDQVEIRLYIQSFFQTNRTNNNSKE